MDARTGESDRGDRLYELWEKAHHECSMDGGSIPPPHVTLSDEDVLSFMSYMEKISRMPAPLRHMLGDNAFTRYYEAKISDERYKNVRMEYTFWKAYETYTGVPRGKSQCYEGYTDEEITERYAKERKFARHHLRNSDDETIRILATHMKNELRYQWNEHYPHLIENIEERMNELPTPENI